MTTPLGKKLKKLRIDRDERLVDMAKRLGKSSSFLSAVETGKKSPPQDLVEDVVRKYALAPAVAEELHASADQSRHVFSLEPATTGARTTVGLLARRMNSLSEFDFEKIQELLNKGNPR